MPETIRRLIMDVGVRPSEAMISWENLDSINRKLLDPVVRRFVFVLDPKPFEITGLNIEHTAKIPLHPDHPEWGFRTFTVGPGKGTILIPSADADSLKAGSAFRLMNLFNVEVTEPGLGKFLSADVADAKRLGARILQWLPAGTGTPFSIIRSDAKADTGVVDQSAIEADLPATFQFYRYGFVRVYREDDGVKGYFAHG